MKRFWAIPLVILLICTFFSCGEKTEQKPAFDLTNYHSITFDFSEIESMVALESVMPFCCHKEGEVCSNDCIYRDGKALYVKNGTEIGWHIGYMKGNLLEKQKLILGWEINGSVYETETFLNLESYNGDLTHPIYRDTVIKPVVANFSLVGMVFFPHNESETEKMADTDNNSKLYQALNKEITDVLYVYNTYEPMPSQEYWTSNTDFAVTKISVGHFTSSQLSSLEVSMDITLNSLSQNYCYKAYSIAKVYGGRYFVYPSYSFILNNLEGVGQSVSLGAQKESTLKIFIFYK